MKARIRIPTKTQFAFIEADVEGDAQFIVDTYNEISDAYWSQGKSGEGLEEKEFNAILDNYCWKNAGMAPEKYEKMSVEQQTILQAIKRSKKRMQYQTRKETEELDTLKLN